MSQENVEVVREVMRAFNDRDESAMSHYAEDVEFRLIGGFSGMAGETLRGREAVLRFAWELIDNLQARFVVERLFEADDRVVLIASTAGRRRRQRRGRRMAVGPGLHAFATA